MVAGALVLAGCDDTFTPIVPGEQRLSVYGYLDASADTQWIRVGLMRPLLPTSPDSLAATVTLERVGGGRTVRLRQVVSRFSTVNSGDAYAHNFWTTERMEPGASYRVRVEPFVGQVAETVVPVPPDYDLEVWLAQGRTPGRDQLRFIGARFVAFVTATTWYSDRCGSTVEPHSFGAAAGDTLSPVRLIQVNKTILGRNQACGTPLPDRRQLWAAAAGGVWPAGVDYSPGALGGAAPSNGVNGVGFVGGVLTRIVPYENCTLAGVTSGYCVLHYDSTSASLSGTLTDPKCNFAVARADVRLTELDAPPTERPKQRWMQSGMAGNYWIGGLVPGMRYRLTVSRNESPEPFTPEYATYQDTIQFTPGQQETRDVAMQRLYFPCPSS
jgi:hypothetical protein